jgi:hypothetical protein
MTIIMTLSVICGVLGNYLNDDSWLKCTIEGRKTVFYGTFQL